METLESLEQKVIGWAKDRQIIPNATPLSQALKMMSEVGELFDAEARCSDTLAKDAVGDILVCLINFRALTNHLIHWGKIDQALAPEPAVGHAVAVATVAAGLVSIATMPNGTEAPSAAEELTQVLLDRLAAYCTVRGFRMVECLDGAYDEIKDRRGTLMPNGVFVKNQ